MTDAHRRAVLRTGAVLLAVLVASLTAMSLKEVLTPPRRLAAAQSFDAATRAVSAKTADAAARVEAPAIRGRILDSDGNAVAGASVRAVSPRAPYEVTAETLSDSVGAFAFGHLAARAVRLVADRDPTGAATSAELSPEEGRTLEVTLVLSATSGVRGTVVGAEDQLLEGATIVVEGVPWAVPAATSDAAGAFRLHIVPREATSIAASARGYATVHVSLPPREDGTEPVLRVALVRAQDVSGEVESADGTPIRATLVACGGRPFESQSTSADDGTFTLPASTIGCDVVASRSDSAPSDPVSVVAGRHLSLRLKAGGSIEGVVVDDHGTGVPTYSLGIESFVPAGSGVFDRTPPRALADPRGAFVLERLAPGRYVLAVSAPERPVTKSAPIDVRVAAATRGVRVLVLRGGVIQGRVYDDHRAPIDGVDVRFDALSSVVESSAHATTDANGHYRLEGAPAGPFTVRVQKGGFRTRLVSGLRIDSGATMERDVTLSTVNGGAGQELGGIGAAPRETPAGIELHTVFPGDPADRAGLRAGDVVLSVDGEPCDGLAIVDVLQRLRGEPGTTVGVSVRRPSTGETVDVLIVRGEIVR